jgi:hypothetical protein
MKRSMRFLICGLVLAAGLRSDETVATALYARVGNGYKREKAKDGSFKPEYYALSNGGRLDGTTADNTVDRVTYPDVATIASRLLTQQNYHYAQREDQATLLIVLQWGNTITFDRISYDQAVKEQDMGKILLLNQVRDQINEDNARILGYMDALADSNDIRRWAGGGDNYNDLIADVEEARYYIMISAYDFRDLARRGRRTLLWQVRVSVRSAGNSFDDSFVPMLKSAAKYFGQDSKKLVRGEEARATVELGDLKFLGEAKEPSKTKPETGK